MYIKSPSRLRAMLSAVARFLREVELQYDLPAVASSTAEKNLASPSGEAQRNNLWRVLNLMGGETGPLITNNTHARFQSAADAALVPAACRLWIFSGHFGDARYCPRRN
ncbi:hypothetical protein E2C01_004771 [Portunus trituberculatus]|uniref:Uncharacterized protein n=1 Tax=Portunus trituberculatus TaxID=210409 RepID=A0A5B7CXB4_PORTR|nr:hypothetical protein [Portunus trituberculatus]